MGKNKEKTKEPEVSAPTEVPDCSTIKGLARDLDTFRGLAAFIHEKRVLKSQLESEIKDAAERASSLMMRAHVKSVMVGEVRVTRKDGVSSRLDKVRLIELGVKPKTIEAATVRTGWSTIVTSVKKENGGGEEGE